MILSHNMHIDKFDWKKLFAGGDSVKSAYDEAIVEGIIDPKEVSLNRFRIKVEGEYYVDPEYLAERDVSKFNVANIFKKKDN